MAVITRHHPTHSQQTHRMALGAVGVVAVVALAVGAAFAIQQATDDDTTTGSRTTVTSPETAAVTAIERGDAVSLGWLSANGFMPETAAVTAIERGDAVSLGWLSANGFIENTAPAVDWPTYNGPLETAAAAQSVTSGVLPRGNFATDLEWLTANGFLEATASGTADTPLISSRTGPR